MSVIKHLLKVASERKPNIL